MNVIFQYSQLCYAFTLPTLEIMEGENGHSI